VDFGDIPARDHVASRELVQDHADRRSRVSSCTRSQVFPPHHPWVCAGPRDVRPWRAVASRERAQARSALRAAAERSGSNPPSRPILPSRPRRKITASLSLPHPDNVLAGASPVRPARRSKSAAVGEQADETSPPGFADRPDGSGAPSGRRSGGRCRNDDRSRPHSDHDSRNSLPKMIRILTLYQECH
jgi:hypothetical protein